MKILHIITSLNAGGAQTMLYQLLRHQRSEQYQFSVVSLVSGGSLAQEIAALDIPVDQLGMQPGRLGPGALTRLSRTVRAFQADVIHTWLYHADLVGGLIARISQRAPVLWGIHHTIASPNTLNPVTYQVVRLNALLSRFIPARIVCCSQTALETHAWLGYQRGKMLVVPNGIDTKSFQPDASARIALRQELQLPEGIKLIGMFARYHPQKDHRNFVLAAGKLHRSMPHVHFVLAGEGVDDDNLQLHEWIDAEGLAGVVHLLGPRRDMPRLYAALDIFTLSSRDGEALPMAIGEAMACGVPSVATDVGDAAQIIGETGYCVPPQEPESLARAWEIVLEMTDLKYRDLGQSARRRIEDRYNLDHISKAYSGLYHELTV